MSEETYLNIRRLIMQWLLAEEVYNINMVTGVGSPQAGANMSAPEKKPPADNRRVSLHTDYIVLLL